MIASCAALVLLAAFTMAIAYQLRRDQHPNCSCFGAKTAPISRRTLVRNGAMVVFVTAALVGSWLYGGVPSRLPADHAAGIAAIVLLAAVQVRQAAVLRALRGQVDGAAAPSSAHESLPIGAVAPDFDLPDLDGRRASMRELLTAGRPLALVFVHPTCAPCGTLADDLRSWRHMRTLTVMPVGAGGVDANATWAREQNLATMLVQHGHEVGARYGVRGTPAAVLVDGHGRIASPVAAGPAAIRQLITAHASTTTV